MIRLTNEDRNNNIQINLNVYFIFQEFLMALDVTQCASEKEKLQWAFRLYDVDGSGSITVKEMENIIQTLDRVNIQKQITISMHRKIKMKLDFILTSLFSERLLFRLRVEAKEKQSPVQTFHL